MDHTGPMDQQSHPKHRQSQGGLFSMVKDTDGPTVWSEGPRIKYDQIDYACYTLYCLRQDLRRNIKIKNPLKQWNFIIICSNVLNFAFSDKRKYV